MADSDGSMGAARYVAGLLGFPLFGSIGAFLLHPVLDPGHPCGERIFPPGTFGDELPLDGPCNVFGSDLGGLVGTVTPLGVGTAITIIGWLVVGAFFFSALATRD